MTGSQDISDPGKEEASGIRGQVADIQGITDPGKETRGIRGQVAGIQGITDPGKETS